MPISWTPQQSWPIVDPVTADRFREFGLWYAGEPGELAKFYRNAPNETFPVRPSQRAGGLQGFFARLFWGQPSVGTAADMERFHIPAAANLSALAADLLYSEPPSVRVDDAGDVDAAATDWLQTAMTDGGGFAVLAESAELASAYGSAYRRVTVDRERAEHPVIEALAPHCAIPEWRSGLLDAVTFWRVLTDPRGGVLRLLERHEPGSVQHQLRLGTANKLGDVAPLDSHPETRRLAVLTGGTGVVATGIPMLDVVHHPHIRPNPAMPNEPYGRSSYWGGIGAMQALDETWSLWMDALRRAQPLIIVPQEYLRGLGPGRGATFDPAQRIFTQIRALDPSQKLQIEQVNFTVDVDRYERTAAGNWRTIVRNGGLSADAFGEEASGAQATATEVGQRGARTIATRKRMADLASVADRQTAAVVLAYGAVYYADQVKVTPDARVGVQFADGVTPDPKKDAEIVGLLDAATAISLQVKVSMAHPEWDDVAVADEVKRIEAEQKANAEAMKVTDPAGFDGTGDPQIPPADPGTPPADPSVG